MREELEAIITPHGWRVGPPPGPMGHYWSLYPPLNGTAEKREQLINLLILAGYDARQHMHWLIAVWV